MTLAPTAHGRGIVTTRMFLGGITRVTVRLDGDVSVLVDQPRSAAAELTVGAAVEVAIAGRVLVANRA
jgi:hypothetical protein